MVHRVTNSFLLLFKKIIFLLVFIILIVCGCERKTADVRAFGRVKDVTEDLYHRLKAGMFDPATDPFICAVRGSSRKVPYGIVRISWDRGTFRVRADDHGKVVIYMNEETVFSHVQMATLKEFRLTPQFSEFHQPPIR